MATVSRDCATLTEKDEITKLELDSRIETVLRIAHKRTIEDLTSLCACGVLDIKGIGWKSMEAILDRLRELGFTLSECTSRRAALANDDE